MNEDTVKGKAKQIKGDAEAKIGAVTDDPGQEIKGRATQAEGKIQEGFGKVKAAIKNVVDK